MRNRFLMTICGIQLTMGFCDIHDCRVVHAAAQHDRDGVLEASKRLGFLTGAESKLMLDAHSTAVMTVGEPFVRSEPFDFSTQTMTKSIHNIAPTILRHR